MLLQHKGPGRLNFQAQLYIGRHQEANLKKTNMVSSNHFRRRPWYGGNPFPHLEKLTLGLYHREQ